MRKEPSGTVDSGTVATRLLPPAQRCPPSQPDARVFRHQPSSTRPGLRHLTVRARLGLLFTLALNWEKKRRKEKLQLLVVSTVSLRTYVHAYARLTTGIFVQLECSHSSSFLDLIVEILGKTENVRLCITTPNIPFSGADCHLAAMWILFELFESPASCSIGRNVVTSRNKDSRGPVPCILSLESTRNGRLSLLLWPSVFFLVIGWFLGTSRARYKYALALCRGEVRSIAKRHSDTQTREEKRKRTLNRRPIACPSACTLTMGPGI